VLEAAEAGGELPLDYMLAVMRDPNADHKRRDAMAMAAARYLHPKLNSVESTMTVRGEEDEQAKIEVVFVPPKPQPADDEPPDQWNRPFALCLVARAHDTNSSSNVLAPFKSRVSNASVNQP
jgi:hypothetical protein